MSVRRLSPPAGYGTWSRAAITDAGLVFTAGHTADLPDGSTVDSDDVRDHMRQAFRNLAETLAEAGCTLEDVVKLTVYLATEDDVAAYGEVKNEFFASPSPPATGVVAQLFAGVLRFEVDAVAQVPAIGETR